MEIPPEVYISVLLKQGNVFYFKEPSFQAETPHNFVLLNSQPTQESPLIFVWATSQVKKVCYFRRREPSNTVVVVNPREYEHFSTDTAFDCNDCLVKTFDDLVQLAKKVRMEPRVPVSVDILGRLIQGVLDSRLISTELKNMVRPIVQTR